MVRRLIPHQRWTLIQFNMLKSFTFFISFALVASSIVARNTPEGFAVTNTNYHGSGCPPNSTLVSFTPDSSAFIVVYEAFGVNIAPGLPSPNSKTCTVTLDLAVPTGYNVRLAPVNTETFRQDDGATGGFDVNSVVTGTGTQLELTTTAVLTAKDSTSTGMLVVDSVDVNFVFERAS
ncbi:hypothetical protein D9611_009020 [Ephemerocybe angulata]|uniref:Uncharacterized protein n=1 Tax=Ephemerocybe angulata TaxID=980116 RepID=A0A8H5BYW1_9AGAR|nr:hypothetical protein D9611_009020 [Tulosesus angulatus]